MISLVKKTAKYFLYKIPSSAVVMFHHVSTTPDIQRSGCLLETEKFKTLIESNEDYAPLIEVIKRPHRRKLAITFDDGLEDLYTIAYPYLKEKGIPFTAFIATDFLDQPGYITTKQLIEMASDKTVTIGSHGVTHDCLNQLTKDEKRREIIESKKQLEDIIGKPVELFAYSHGEYDKECFEYIDTYTYALSVNPLPLNFVTHKDRAVPRINFDETDFEKSVEKLRKILKR